MQVIAQLLLFAAIMSLFPVLWAIHQQINRLNEQVQNFCLKLELRREIDYRKELHEVLLRLRPKFVEGYGSHVASNAQRKYLEILWEEMLPADRLLVSAMTPPEQTFVGSKQLISLIERLY